MFSRPLLVFDFDGVIIDGMDEYWWSARQACSLLLSSHNCEGVWSQEAQEMFRRLRPFVQHGWEMVLLAAELVRDDSPLRLKGIEYCFNNYASCCLLGLQAWGWHPEQLQTALEEVRSHALTTDRASWLSLHRPFPGVVERLSSLPAEGADWVVLTTKAAEFTKELLSFFCLSPLRVYGHESGAKPEVLHRLAGERLLRGFVEDRRATLEKVLATPGLEDLRCYLVSWGYLCPGDFQELPPQISLLDQTIFKTPLATWP